MHKEPANVMRAAEMGGDMGVKRILNSAELVNMNREMFINASQEFHRVLAKCTGSEAEAIVLSVSDIDGVKHGTSPTRTTARGRRAGCSECSASACIPKP